MSAHKGFAESTGYSASYGASPRLRFAYPKQIPSTLLEQSGFGPNPLAQIFALKAGRKLIAL